MAQEPGGGAGDGGAAVQGGHVDSASDPQLHSSLDACTTARPPDRKLFIFTMY